VQRHLLGVQGVSLARSSGTHPPRHAGSTPVFQRTSVHFDHRTYTLKGEVVSLNTLQGRMRVPMILGDQPRQILASGLPKEAELVFRRGQWFFNLVVESADAESVTSGPVMGVDVGENTLAATSTGRIWGGETLRHRRDQHLWPCVVASSPTAARVRLKDSGRSPARNGGASNTSTTKRARRFWKKPDALVRPRS